MSFWDSFRRGFVIGTLICFPFYLALFLFTQCSVGERAPSPSHGVAIDTPRPGSEAAPARSLADGNGEDVVLVEEAKVDGFPRLTAQPEPASTVTHSALTATATVVIDHVPATPPAVSTHPSTGPTYDPWPAYLWPVVECLIQRESEWNPLKVGIEGEIGWLQIHPANFAYLARFGITPDQLYDPPTNIRAGWLLYLYWENAIGDGFWPWKSTRGGCA